MWTAKPSAFKSEVPEQHQGMTILDLESKVTLAFAHARVDVEVSPLAIVSMTTPTPLTNAEMYGRDGCRALGLVPDDEYMMPEVK